MVMADEQAESRITVDKPGGRDGSRRGPAGWVLPLIGLLILGVLWSFRGEVTEESDLPADLGAAEPVTTTTMPPLEGDLSIGWVAIDLPGEGAIVEILSSRFGLFAVGTDGHQASVWKSSDGVIWGLVGTENEAFAGAEVNALVETDSGLVAVGAWTDTTAREPEAEWVYGRERRRPAVWLSIDGETWERIPDDLIERSAGDRSPTLEARRLGSMNDVVVWEGRLVAVGWSSSADHLGAAWVADMDGRAWKPATRGLTGSGTAFTEVSSVTVVDQGLVAVGSVLSRPSVWLSQDAMTWSVPYPNALGTQRHDRPLEVTAGPAGLVAIGPHQQRFSDYVEPPARAYSVIWLSRDGEEWLRLEPEELTGVILGDVIAEDPWLVAVGVHAVDITERPGVWYSATGAEWQAIDLGTEDHQWGDSKVHAIARGGPGLVAGGTLEGKPEVWLWSPHGPVVVTESVWVRPATGRWAFRAALDPGFPTWSIGETPGGYAAAYRGFVRTSLDGLAWETLPIEELGLPADGRYEAPVIINETAYLVNENGSIWSSPGGRFWTLLADGFSGWLEGPRPGRNDELLLLEHPRYHFGEENQFRIWRSVDGVNWSELPLPAVEFVQDVSSVGDRYILLGASYDGRPSLWASTQDGGWDPVELSAEYVAHEGFAEVNGRLLMAVSDSWGWEGQVATTRILTTSDGERWEMSDMEFAGWPTEIGGWDGSRVFMILDTTEPGRSNPKFAMWSSADGMEWTQLGALPAFADSWPRILSTRAALRIVFESEQHSGIWEWVPPAG